METISPYITIPTELARLIGRPDAGTRIFRREGSVDEMREWFDMLCEHVGPCVSPGGAAVYAGVTRAGVHKRLKNGKLTIFCFNTLEKAKTLFGREKIINGFPSGYIPVSECQAWRRALEQRQERIVARKRLYPLYSTEEAANKLTKSCQNHVTSDLWIHYPR